MSTDSKQPSGDQTLFWGCFIALITTAFAFITRANLTNEIWPDALGLDEVETQELFFAGIWPFAISIILFSLIIDRIGYKTAMYFSFVCYTVYSVLAIIANSVLNGESEGAQGTAHSLLYWGSVILGLGNGTVEAYINPVVATMFRKEKTKWLNILHAGWPGGLVLGGLLTIGITVLLSNAFDADLKDYWIILIFLIALPAVVFLIMLSRSVFPVTERVASGTSYKEMLSEFGAAGALIASALIFSQLGEIFKWGALVSWTLVGLSTIAFGAYCRSFGRPILIVLCIIMMPLAITELGTDGTITGIMVTPMENAGWDPLWVLVYTSAIMMVLRFFAGPIVGALTPIGLLVASAFLAVIGLYLLSDVQGVFLIFSVATLYGLGKTFFWPTMLGVVSEQCPKGGALTLNAIAGIGMLAVGIIGGPWIGKMQEDSIRAGLDETVYNEIKAEEKKRYVLGGYTALDVKKVEAYPDGDIVKMEIEAVMESAPQSALARVALFPLFMLICYVGLALYFRSRGGYKTVNLRIKGEDDSA